MATIIINDVEYAGEVGERLVDVARRNGAHIGFVCEGLIFFLFQTNACRVLKGTELLSPPSELEQNWLQPSWIEAGHRLACEAVIQGNGTIEILSHAEELRRQTNAIFTPPEGTTSGENAGLLFNNMGRMLGNQVVRFPFNMLGAAPVWFKRVQAGQIRPICLFDLPNIVRDGGKVIQNMTGNPEQMASEEKKQLPA